LRGGQKPEGEKTNPEADQKADEQRHEGSFSGCVRRTYQTAGERASAPSAREGPVREGCLSSAGKGAAPWREVNPASPGLGLGTHTAGSWLSYEERFSKTRSIPVGFLKSMGEHPGRPGWAARFCSDSGRMNAICA
jgi:hypothetical protein